MNDTETYVCIDYTNHRGERSVRWIRPLTLEFESNEYHPDKQWIIYADDVLKGKMRGFALMNIHSWTRITTQEEK